MKNRKLFAALLSLVLAVMIPMTSLAATAVDISVMPGDAILSEMPEDMRPAVVDLFNALGIRVLTGEKSGMLSLMISGKNALDIAYRPDETGLFVQSALLGEKPLYFDKEDLINFVLESMKSQGETIDAATENELRESFNTLFAPAAGMSTVQGMDAEAAAEPVDFVFDKDAAIAAVAEMYADDPAMVTCVTNLLNNTVVTEGEYTSENRDPANVCMTMTMTGEDFVILLDSPTMQSNIAQVAAQNNMTEEEAKATLKKEFEEMDLKVVCTFYIVKEGSEFVGMDVDMIVKDDKNDPESDVVTMDFTMDRLTTDVVTYTIKLNGSEDDEPEMGGNIVVVDDQNGKITLDGTLYDYEDDGVSTKDAALLKGEFTTANDIFYGWFGVVDAEQQEAITVAFSSQPTADGVALTADLYVRENAAAPIAPVASDAPAFTIKVAVSENVSEEALAVVDTATVDGSLQLLKMSETELNKYAEQLSNNAVNLAVNALPLLPSSVLQLFMNVGQ